MKSPLLFYNRISPRFLLLLFLLLTHCLSLPLFSQQRLGVDVLTQGNAANLRGMSIPNEQTIWASGTKGTVVKSVDGGKTWRWLKIDGYEQNDFRDIEAFDSSTAIAMAVGNPAFILKTTDGGFHWKKVFERTMEGMFLDAMDFKNSKEGICVGDPVNMPAIQRRVFYIIRTSDGGDTWSEVPLYQMPPAEQGEAIFAASGTNISFLDHPDFEYAFVTGGLVSQLYMIGRNGKQSKAAPIPILQARESAGTFSFATDKLNRYYCIGGDWKIPKDYFDNFYYSTNAGKSWGSPSLGPPFGYRSCIRIIEDKTMVACGPTGVDFTTNAQKDWKRASLEGFNVCMVSKGRQVFLAGDNGKIGKLIY